MAGTVVIDTVQSSVSTPPVFKNTSGTEIGTLCRAWVNFNGVTTASIRASFNVLTVTRTAAGVYTIQFVNNMPDINYAVLGTCRITGASSAAFSYQDNINTVSQISVASTVTNTGSATDSSYFSVGIFR